MGRMYTLEALAVWKMLPKALGVEFGRWGWRSPFRQGVCICLGRERETYLWAAECCMLHVIPDERRSVYPVIPSAGVGDGWRMGVWQGWHVGQGEPFLNAFICHTPTGQSVVSDWVYHHRCSRRVLITCRISGILQLNTSVWISWRFCSTVGFRSEVF